MDFGMCDTGSPILISLDSNTGNLTLTSPSDGVKFDIAGDGIQRQIAWTQPPSNVGFLALDRNGNGRIDNGSELFGDATWMSNGGRAAHGFEALLDLDGGSQSDGRIDGTDAAYRLLRLWFDRNHNGVSEPEELVSLEAAGIAAILTEYSESRRTDQHGNIYRYSGTALLMRKDQRLRTRKVFDVFLKVLL